MNRQMDTPTPATAKSKFARKKVAMLKIGLSIALLAVIFYFVDFRELIDTLVNVSLPFIVAGVVLTWIDRALMAYKWKPLLEVVGLRVPFSLLYSTYMLTSVTNLLLPSTIGGDLFRVYNLSRYKLNTNVVFASVVMERLIGFLAILILVFISLALAFYLMTEQFPFLTILRWILLAGAAVFLVLIASMSKVSRGWFKKFGEKFSHYPLASKISEIYSLFSEYRNHRGTLAVVLSWSFLEQFAPIIVGFVIVRALHVEVSILELIIIMPVIQVANRLPISFDGIGVKEGLYVGLFSLVGVSVSEALLMSGIGRLLPVISAVPWSIHYILWDRRTISPECKTTM